MVEQAPGRTVEVGRVPLGVIGAITPWNFPILLAIWKIAPALVAGNTMVLKPSPYTSLCTLKLGELLRDILPPGVLNVVSSGNDLGAWLTRHPDVRKISFTGSTSTGRKIMAAAAGTLKRITLELGGNDAAIVLPDVDVEATAKELFWAAFQNRRAVLRGGQAPVCPCRHLRGVRRCPGPLRQDGHRRPGLNQGTDLGPIQNRMQFDKVKELLADSRAAGHAFLLGGEAASGPGYFVPVTIIDNPPDDSRVGARGSLRSGPAAAAVHRHR